VVLAVPFRRTDDVTEDFMRPLYSLRGQKLKDAFRRMRTNRVVREVEVIRRVHRLRSRH
jgi:hypothetical protein